jgi:hypothetical protein
VGFFHPLKIAVMKQKVIHLKRLIRRWLVFFMASLIISGITALDTTTGINWLSRHTGNVMVSAWVNTVKEALGYVNLHHSFLFYGYDWLAFAHVVIAVAFIGPYIDPVRNKWVIQFGRIAAIMIIPFALTAGAIRNIPFWWQLVDCSFGIIALLPLSKCYWLIENLETLEPYNTAAAQQNQVVTITH